MLVAICTLLMIQRPTPVLVRYETALQASTKLSHQPGVELHEVWQPLINHFAAEIDWNSVLVNLKKWKGDKREVLKDEFKRILPMVVSGKTHAYMYVAPVLNTEAMIHMNVRMPVSVGDFGIHQNFCRLLFNKQSDGTWKGEMLQAIGFPQYDGDTWQFGQGAFADGRLHFIGPEQEYSTGGQGGIEVWEKVEGLWERVQHIISKGGLGPYESFARKPDGSYDVERVVMRTTDFQRMTYISNLGPDIYREELFVFVNGKYESQGGVPYDSALRTLDDLLFFFNEGDLKAVRELCLTDAVYDQFISVDYFSEQVYASEIYEEGDRSRFPPSDLIELTRLDISLTFAERDGKRRLSKFNFIKS